jgi:hypothetical protein
VKNATDRMSDDFSNEVTQRVQLTPEKLTTVISQPVSGSVVDSHSPVHFNVFYTHLHSSSSIYSVPVTFGFAFKLCHCR